MARNRNDFDTFAKSSQGFGTFPTSFDAPRPSFFLKFGILGALAGLCSTLATLAFVVGGVLLISVYIEFPESSSLSYSQALLPVWIGIGLYVSSAIIGLLAFVTAARDL